MKKKYEVVTPNCRGFKIGEIVELSDESAAQLVYKIKPVVAEEKKTPAKRKVKVKSEPEASAVPEPETQNDIDPESE